MASYSLTHVSDRGLLDGLAALIARDHRTIAALLAVIAEVDVRRLYRPAGYPSMYVYCVEKLRLSEDVAYKRIQAARVARRCPVVFGALADGRIHLAGVCLLAPYLTPANVDELLAAATHRSKSGIERMLARRFPRTETMALVETVFVMSAAPVARVPDGQAPRTPPDSRRPACVELAPGQVESKQPEPSPASCPELAPGQVEPEQPEPSPASCPELAPGQVESEQPEPGPASCGEPAPGQVRPADLRSSVAPVATHRFEMRLTIHQELHDKLRHAQALLSHQLPAGDVAEVLERALDALISRLEKRKFAATDRPRQVTRAAIGDRYVPAHVKRAVWRRDGGQCTFVSDDGHRCPARAMLEFDHIDPVARGGRATIEQIRLRCRAHNQHGAERAFGVEFMRRKREEARRRRSE